MRRPGKRFTIGRVMAWTAAVACLLAFSRPAPRGFVWHGPSWVAGLAAVVAALALANVLIAVVSGRRCPACSRWALRRLARRRNYFQCSLYRARVKRFGLAPWLDASGDEDAWRYPSRFGSRPWQGFAVPEAFEGSSCGRLLMNKRSRGRLTSGARPPSPPADGWRKAENRTKREKLFRAWRDSRVRRGDDATEAPSAE